jgi:hypothetical protein
MVTMLWMMMDDDEGRATPSEERRGATDERMLLVRPGARLKEDIKMYRLSAHDMDMRMYLTRMDVSMVACRVVRCLMQSCMR